MIIDFREIPRADTGEGNQDTFELFARDFLAAIGYEIINSPARGADGGIDIKVRETLKGISVQSEVYWLVSCKHKAHSGKSVSPSIEQNILDRVHSNGCDGFIGFYSSLPSSGLENQISGLGRKIRCQVFDSGKIEERIVGISNMENLFIRYFPESFKKWREIYYYTEPLNLFKYYFNGKYSKFEYLIEGLFGSFGNFIKELRVIESFEEAVKRKSFQRYIIPNLNRTLWDFPESFTYGKIEKWSIRSMYEEHLPKELEHRYGIKGIVSNVLSSIGPGTSRGVYILYSNALVVSENIPEELSLMYDDLKEMLK